MAKVRAIEDAPVTGPRLRASLSRAGRVASCLLGVALVAQLAGCGRIQRHSSGAPDSFKVTLTTEPAPPLVGDGLVIVTLADSAGRPVDGARLNLEGNMSHAGMVPVFEQATGGQQGVYRVPFQWTMAGDWIIDLKATLPQGQRLDRQFPISVLASP